MKFMPIRDFLDSGYLQEVNRRFFHPLGLALVVEAEDDGTASVSGVWDYRHDPEGIVFSPGEVDPNKAEFIENEETRRRPIRAAALGYWVQPIKEKP